MAHSISAKKRIRQNASKRLENRYYGKTTRNLIRDLKALEDKKEATTLLPIVISKIDKLAKRNDLHKNKANNLKSKLTKHVATLA